MYEKINSKQIVQSWYLIKIACVYSRKCVSFASIFFAQMKNTILSPIVDCPLFIFYNWYFLKFFFPILIGRSIGRRMGLGIAEKMIESMRNVPVIVGKLTDFLCLFDHWTLSSWERERERVVIYLCDVNAL